MLEGGWAVAKGKLKTVAEAFFNDRRGWTVLFWRRLDGDSMNGGWEHIAEV
jgi:hypothetical protein